MTDLALETDVVDPDVYARTLELFRAAKIVLPTFRELADPTQMSSDLVERLAAVDPDEPHPLNLFRVHWYNAADRRGRVDVPGYVELDERITGVRAPILVALGDRFPMIQAHKVLPAYACLVPRLVTGGFDPARHRAVWPSTGNYCRGGVAISRILGCRGVAVLPEGMSEERFEWLGRWVVDDSDVVRTPGTESNVKEIYDECHRLARDPSNVIFNQFSEYANYLGHRKCTGRALAKVYEDARASTPGMELFAFVSATGSAGTLAAGDHLKEHFGTRIVAAEALECPTLSRNGYGEHNIQGIGDKHVPLIHNVMNTDYVSAVSDRSTDSLNLLFNTEVGRTFLSQERELTPELIEAMGHFGLSSLCNVLSAIALAKREDLGPDQAVVTVATDGAPLYETELEKASRKYFGGPFKADDARAVFTEHLMGASDENLQDLGDEGRERIFNLGYFTWVEQQGVTLADFEARRSQEFWDGMCPALEAWDEAIDALNRGVEGS